jgi:hypothetical protein
MQTAIPARAVTRIQPVQIVARRMPRPTPRANGFTTAYAITLIATFVATLSGALAVFGSF